MTRQAVKAIYSEYRKHWRGDIMPFREFSERYRFDVKPKETKTDSAPNGVVFYRGPSMLDGAPIIGVATGILKPSSNIKTGKMIQTWIIREDIPPSVAAAIGLDKSFCGNCIHSKKNLDTCYVLTDHAPRQVYESFHRGAYPLATDSEINAIRETEAKHRGGSFGDPTAIPFEVWVKLGVDTGYTHQWRDPRFQEFKALFMASVDSEAEAREAMAMGWRCFLVRNPGDAIPQGFIDCPHEAKGVQCDRCGLCNGNKVKAKSISNVVHGAKASRFLKVVN